jgi:hypothetical protein
MPPAIIPQKRQNMADELGLADHGLEYIHPEIVCRASFYRRT